MNMLSPTEALERLVEGNRRFVSGAAVPPATRGHRADLAQGQQPFAVVLGCSDSRVPVETVFDQGPGDLFVIRVAGNIAAPSQIGSVEFAAEVFGTCLVVVMGHSRCGAIQATLADLQSGSGAPSRNLRAIVDRIRPSLEGLPDPSSHPDPATLLRDAVRANVGASVSALRSESEILERLVGEGRVVIVGAEYSLETGVVDFFHGVPSV